MIEGILTILLSWNVPMPTWLRVFATVLGCSMLLNGIFKCYIRFVSFRKSINKKDEEDN